jgi:hypothetical protein
VCRIRPPSSDLCHLICIDPARAAEIWPHVRALIAQAMARGGVSDFSAVEARVLDGRALLWIAWERTGEGAGSAAGAGRVLAAAVTELAVVNGRKLCVIAACGGSDRRRWLPALREIEDFARAEGCAAMLVMGRRGWKRALRHYRERGIILEKELK